MTFGERIKKARKVLDLTQQELASRIGIKPNSISLIESGNRNASEQVILSICREFGVNETWLRTGKGEMFIPTPKESVDELIRVHGLDDLDRQIILEFIKLSPDDREVVKKYVRNLAQHVGPASEPPPALALAQDKPAIVPPGYSSREELEQEVDQEVERYRQQLLLEKRQALQASTVKESGTA